MCSRVSHDPDWGPQARSLLAARTEPVLVSQWPLPDIPDPALRQVLTGHTGEVTAVAISPDGTWLASASWDWSARTWEAATGRERALLTRHTGAVRGVAIAPDSTWIATCGYENSVRIWDVPAGRRRVVRAGHTGEVTAVAIASDGTWLATAGVDMSVRIWDLVAGRPRAVITGHKGAVRAVAIAPDGTWLATSSHDSSVRIWDPATGQQRGVITGHTGVVTAVAVAPDGSWLATGSHDRSVRIWDMPTGQQRTALTGHTEEVTALAIAPDGAWLATAGADRSVRIWDPATGQQRGVITGHTGVVTAIAVAPDGRWIATGSGDGSVRIWDPAAAHPPAIAATSQIRDVSVVDFAPDDTWLASADGNTVRIWDVATGQQRAALAGHTGEVAAVAIAPDGTWLASADGNTVRIWDVATGQQRAALAGHTGWVTAVAIAPDGTWLASTGRDELVRVWDVATGQQRAALAGHAGWVTAVAIAPDGTWLASTGRDELVRVWDVATGQQRAALAGHAGWVTAVAIAPDGTWLASTGRDELVRVWDVATGQQRAALAGHAGWVTAMAIAPDGTRLASTGSEGSIRIWDVAAAAACAVVRVDGSLNDCRWSPNGQILATAGDAGIYLFAFNSAQAHLDLDIGAATITGVSLQPGGIGTARHWEPALTPRDAAPLMIPKDQYGAAALYARMAVEEHQALGTAREHWEPRPNHNANLTAPFITDGEQELASRLEKEADPALDRAQDLIENVKASLGELAEHTRPIASPESGSNYSVAEAVERVRQHDATIERDEAAGRHHHRRVSVPLQRVAAFAPWVETVGFLTFITYYLNVPLLEPWRDWLGWSFAVTVVVEIILGQTWLVRHAARSHNHAREAYVNRHRDEAERGFTRRNWYLWLTAVTAVAITSGMIWRGVAALGSASFGTTAVMIFVAAVTGLLLPTLAYLGVALDGSKVSRERDGLAADLEDDLDAYLQTISDMRRDLASVAEIVGTLKNKTFPDISNAAQEAVEAVYVFYNTVRLLIGGLSVGPPSKTAKTINRDAAGNISGYIGTSIPGSGKVSLDPLFDRQRRLEEIEAQRVSLLNRIDAFLPPHPYSKSRWA